MIWISRRTDDTWGEPLPPFNPSLPRTPDLDSNFERPIRIFSLAGSCSPDYFLVVRGELTVSHSTVLCLLVGTFVCFGIGAGNLPWSSDFLLLCRESVIRILIFFFIHPGSRGPGFRIQQAQQKRKGERDFFILPVLYHKFHKIWTFTEEHVSQLTMNYTFSQKLSLSSQKYGLGIRNKENTFSGSRMRGSIMIRIRDTAGTYGPT